MRILVVENDGDLGELLEMVLLEVGHDVIWAADADEALDVMIA